MSLEVVSEYFASLFFQARIQETTSREYVFLFFRKNA